MTDSQQQRNEWCRIAAHAASLATGFIAGEARSRHTITWEEKSATDFVSHVDLGAEEIIRLHFAREAPDIRIVGEEMGGGGTEQGLVAIVDPLDGTTNFLHGYPNYAVSICIARDGVPQAAAIHDVARNGVYKATLGGGAFRDDQPIHVSTLTTPARALIGTGFPFKDQSFAARYMRHFSKLIPQVAGLRRAGAAALDLCDVACGRFDGFWELMLAPWDLAAGILLVREAGGRATDLEGNDALLRAGPIAAGNPVMHEWLLEQLALADRQS